MKYLMGILIISCFAAYAGKDEKGGKELARGDELARRSKSKSFSKLMKSSAQQVSGNLIGVASMAKEAVSPRNSSSMLLGSSTTTSSNSDSTLPVKPCIGSSSLHALDLAVNKDTRLCLHEISKKIQHLEEWRKDNEKLPVNASTQENAVDALRSVMGNMSYRLDVMEHQVQMMRCVCALMIILRCVEFFC